MSEATAGHASADSIADSASAQGASAPAKPRILHVDDNEANRYAVSRTLLKAGFAVEEAVNGREALKKVSSLLPDLLILDVRLPDISGFDVCQQVKGDPATSNIPVLHLSASFTTSRDKAYGLEMGADAYLVRPAEPMELIATVNALLRQRRAEDKLREANAALGESERRYRFLADAMPQIVWTAAPDGSLEYFNQRWFDYTGLTFEESRREGADRVIHPDELAESRAEWNRAVDSGELYQAETRYRRADGQYRWHLVRALPMRDGRGRITHWFGTSTDIDDQKQAQQALQQASTEAETARRAAETASRLKDEFLATLSHELRTPLNAVVGWAQLLRGANVDEEDLREGLETIERNAKVQAQLIEDLLDVSRITSGKLRLDVKEIELGPVIEAAIASVQPAIEARGVQLHRVLDSQSSVVWGDPSRLQQVVWNLLSNAVKFTPRGGRVQVALTQINSNVDIIVSDSGKGIPASFLPYVFERFRQADASTTRIHGGLGLGLSIVRQLVELHGGTVRAESEGENKGATFTVSLPLIAAHQAEGASSVAPPAQRPVRPISDRKAEKLLAGLNILLVDDEPDARALLRRILTNSQAQVVTAASVAEAMGRLKTGRFDVLVSDIGMPDQDGYELIRQVRELALDQGGKMPAVALTAFARSEDRQQALLAGFNMHMAKPVEPADLIASLAAVARCEE